MPRHGRPPELRREYERLLGLVLILCVLGAIWVYSASSSEAILKDGSNGTEYLLRYVMFGGLGFALLAASSRYGVAFVRGITVPVMIASLVLCMAVVLPGIGKQVNGAYRWLGGGPLTFQPSELAKFAMIAFLALRLSRRRRPMRTLGDLRIELLTLGLLIAIVAGVQRDLGTAIVIVGAAVCVLITAGMPGRFFLPIGAAAGFAALVLVAMHPYRIARLTSFLSPSTDASGTGYQAIQGQIAIGSGGMLGNGLGNSVQKADWLPEAHTDFILAVVGEELGAIGILMLLVLYAGIAYTGLRIADRTRGTYQKLLAVGITGVIICQAMLNVWVVLGIFPLTGVPLPFISYGGTNLMVLLGAVGILLNIARGTPYLEPAPEPEDDPRGRARGPVRDERPGAVRGRRAPAGPRPARRPAYASARAQDRGPARASRFPGDAEDVRDRSRRDGGARGAGAGRRRRAS
ncbi:putative lipid II flippase FtsW [Patulibacter sp. SYSU D01012]|uniref:putative lipid II flippase FtsW n=1 Tax=Patulibacter sp. SYSU D01012 TaxID=2817381 RepID=UPI001B317A99|nr:putative lipid II flippase FtsW [Patulibacter sp. SYSU D01012]